MDRAELISAQPHPEIDWIGTNGSAIISVGRSLMNA